MAGRTVLVVEDEAFIRFLAVHALTDAGCAVVEFATADQAAPFCAALDNEIAAVVTDINMPGAMDGLDLATLVTTQRPGTVVVVTSGRYQEPPADLADRVRFPAQAMDATAIAGRLGRCGGCGPGLIVNPEGSTGSPIVASAFIALVREVTGRPPEESSPFVPLP